MMLKKRSKWKHKPEKTLLKLPEILKIEQKKKMPLELEKIEPLPLNKLPMKLLNK